jgi:anti-sigma factor RsiW
MNWQHIPDHDLERFYLGMVSDEIELARLEEHLLACPECAARADASDQFVDLIRQAMNRGDYDVALEHLRSERQPNPRRPARRRASRDSETQSEHPTGDTLAPHS